MLRAYDFVRLYNFGQGFAICHQGSWGRGFLFAKNEFLLKRADAEGIETGRAELQVPLINIHNTLILLASAAQFMSPIPAIGIHYASIGPATTRSSQTD